MTQPEQILAGVRVLDFGRYIGGPYCSALLGDLGAEVVRVERVSGAEDRVLQPVASDGSGAQFLQCNRGKRSITLDTRGPAGRAVLADLVRPSDIVVVSSTPGGLASAGLDYPTLRSFRSDVIVTLVTGAGSDSPAAERPMFDGIVQALSGAMHLSGPPGTPTRATAQFVDFGTAFIAALATVSALLYRERTGEGQFVEASLMKTGLTMMNAMLIEEALLTPDRASTWNRGTSCGPADVYPTLDGHVITVIAGDAQFRRWCALVERPDLLDDARFVDDAARGRHGEALSEIMGGWCRTRTSTAALDLMTRHGVPGSPVHSPREVLADPDVQASAFLRELAYPGAPGPVPLARFPATLSRTPAQEPGPPPTAGQHTDEILAGLGYSEERIAQLRRDRTV